MRNRFTSLVLLGAAWGLSSAANAADQPGSYSANGKCFCNLPIPASLAGEIVSTPVGGQSLAQVCERVGTGPELKQTGKAYNYSVYDDMQCGHGPGLAGFSALLSDAGMSQENLGPKWDIEAAYANQSLQAKRLFSEDIGSSNNDAFKSGEVLRLRSRYIQVPTSSNVATAKNYADESAVKQSRSITQKVAAAKQNTGTAQSAEERRRIEVLPLATVEPLEGAGFSDAANASSVAQAESAPIIEEVKTVTEVVTQPSVNIDAGTTTAIRVPGDLSTESDQYDYVSVTPTGYDFGGAGVQFSASSIREESFGVLVRAGLAEDYQEILVGATYLQRLGNSDRLKIGLSGGIEYGRFNLEAGRISTNSTSTGAFVRARSIYEISRRFELQGGLGYSSFFEGDPHVFGAALFHMTQKLDFIGEFEVGDNDSAGLGIRYYYR